MERSVSSGGARLQLGSAREARADTRAPDGRAGHAPQVKPLEQFGAEGQELSELDEPLAKVESTRSTLVLSHFAQWTSVPSAPTGCSRENRSSQSVHLYS